MATGRQTLSLPATESHLNIFAPLIRRPIGTSLLAIGLMLAGSWAYQLLGVAALPALDMPVVMVSAGMQGASAQTMASTVAAPLERHLGRIPGIQEMYSSSSEGRTFVRLQLYMGRNADKAANDVQAAINAAAEDLPSHLDSPPQYFKADTNSVPVILVTLTSASLPPD